MPVWLNFCVYLDCCRLLLILSFSQRSNEDVVTPALVSTQGFFQLWNWPLFHATPEGSIGHIDCAELWNAFRCYWLTDWLIENWIFTLLVVSVIHTEQRGRLWVQSLLSYCPVYLYIWQWRYFFFSPFTHRIMVAENFAALATCGILKWFHSHLLLVLWKHRQKHTPARRLQRFKHLFLFSVCYCSYCKTYISCTPVLHLR